MKGSNRNKNLSPGDKLRLLKRFEALIIEGASQKEAAGICGICQHTAGKYMVELGLKDKQETNFKAAAKKRDPDSANLLLIKTKHQYPNLYPAVLEAFNNVFNSK